MLSFFVLLAARPEPFGPAGRWINPARTVIVEIVPCETDRYCGTVAWASDKAITDARWAGTDPLVGATLLSNFKANGSGRWRGLLFIPDQRMKAHAEMTQIDSDHIRIKGCTLVKMLCRSQVWTRQPSLVPSQL